jgi:GDP-L-fucose synthase
MELMQTLFWNVFIDYRGGMYKNKKVLVAGGTGALGVPLVKRLVEMGADVNVVSLDSYEYAKLVLPVEAHFFKADLTDYEVCYLHTIGMDYVFNLMAIKGSVSRKSKNHLDFVSCVLYQLNLMNASFHNNVERFLFVGSICSYPQMSIPKKEDQMWNGFPVQTDKYHGLIKRFGEIQGETYLTDGVWDGVRVIRLSNCYGPYDDFNMGTAQAIPALIAKVESGMNPVKIIGDGSAVRDFVYMDDAVEGCLCVMEKGLPCVPLNLGGESPVTIKNLVEIIGRVSGKDIVFEYDSKAYSGDPIRVLDSFKLWDALGFTCKVGLEEGIRRTFEWYRENRGLTNLKGLINV